MRIPFLGIAKTVLRFVQSYRVKSRPERSFTAPVVELQSAPMVDPAWERIALNAQRVTVMSDSVFSQLTPRTPSDIPNPIPEYDRSAWRQPWREDILVSDETAMMSKAVFEMLREYSHSVPTGVSDGKMWKSRWEDVRTGEIEWYLRWFEIKQQTVFTHCRKIIISPWKKLLGR